MGVEPTQDGITAPQTVLKTAPATGPGVAPSGHVNQSTKDMLSWMTRPNAPLLRSLDVSCTCPCKATEGPLVERVSDGASTSIGSEEIGRAR